MFDTPKALRNRDTARRKAYEDNLQFYRGRQWYAPRTPFARQGGARQLVLNYARLFITKSASYTVSDLKFVADATDSSPRAMDAAAMAETAIRQVAEQNALDLLDFDNEVDCSVLGDAAYKVTWDIAEDRVRVTTPDVTGLYAWRRPDDARDIVRVAQRYTLPADDAGALYDIAAASAKPTIVEDWTADRFVLWVDGVAVRDEPNPYGFLPYVIYPNLREPHAEWGESDIPAIMTAAQEFNRLLSQLSSIAELSGNPITVLEGVTESTDIGVQPGALWELPEGAKAYLLDLLEKGGVQLLLNYAELVRATLHDLAETPRSAFGDATQALSGVALKLAMDPLVKKVARKRLIRSRALTHRNGMVLALLRDYAGLDELAAAQVLRPVWGDVSPADRSRNIADEVAAVNAGIHSRRTAASNLGDANPDEELQRWLDEAAQISAVQPTQAPTPAKGPTAAA